MGRDLRQVGHAQDLVAPGEAPQAPPDRVGAPTADPGVDLVEDERRRRVGLGQDRLMARATRDSSPPEAIRASGRAGSPGFGARR